MAHLVLTPMNCLTALRAGGDVDKIRRSVEFVLQALIEVEATEAIGAAPYERSEARTAQRNGHRRGCSRPRPAMWSGHPQAPSGQLLPLDPGTPSAH